MTDVLAWLDLETMGLATDDPIIEVGIMLTDLNLNEIDYFTDFCWEEGYAECWEKAPDIVKDMHGRSGLIDRARENGVPRARIEELAVDWLTVKNALGLPMCGNSLGTDKRWLGYQMPNLLEAFHYRVIDVSSFKEACRHWNPEVFAKAPVKKEAHTAIEDLRESIAEFKFYLDNFLWDGRGE